MDFLPDSVCTFGVFTFLLPGSRRTVTVVCKRFNRLVLAGFGPISRVVITNTVPQAKDILHWATTVTSLDVKWWQRDKKTLAKVLSRLVKLQTLKLAPQEQHTGYADALLKRVSPTVRNISLCDAVLSAQFQFCFTELQELKLEGRSVLWNVGEIIANSKYCPKLAKLTLYFYVRTKHRHELGIYHTGLWSAVTLLSIDAGYKCRRKVGECGKMSGHDVHQCSFERGSYLSCFAECTFYQTSGCCWSAFVQSCGFPKSLLNFTDRLEELQISNAMLHQTTKVMAQQVPVHNFSGCSFLRHC
jgi:hypothetical protein